MICSLSNVVATQPVFGIPTGLIYERSTIEKVLLSSGEFCPVTGLPLTLKDLVPMRQKQAIHLQPPRSLENGSIPSLLASFQNEWDAVVIETFELKQLLEKRNKELAVALYQYDAAMRVIARLTRERDEARQLQSFSSSSVPHPPAAAATSVEQPVRERMAPLSPSDLQAISQQEAAYQQERNALRKQKKNQPASSSKVSLHEKEVCSAVSCLDMQGDVIALGKASGRISIVDANSVQELPLEVGSTPNGALKGVKLVAENKALLAYGSTNLEVLSLHGKNTPISAVQFSTPLVQCCAHTTRSDFCFALEERQTWSFLRLETGQVALEGLGRSALGSHPDGKLFATGSSQDIVIFDLLTGQPMGSPIACPSPVLDCLSFSENGIMLGATCRDQSVLVWDMRKPAAPLHVFAPHYSAFAFDTVDGSHLALASSVQGFSLLALNGAKKQLVFETTKHPLVSLACSGPSRVVTLDTDGVVWTWTD